MKPGDSVVVYNSRGRTWLSALGIVSIDRARSFVNIPANYVKRPYCIVRLKSLKNNANPL